jgi:hypothetical protein
MLGIPNRPEKGVIEIDLPLGWRAEGIASRRAVDVGHPVMVYVTILSAVEAAQINARYKKQAEETLRARLAEQGPGYIGSNIDANAVHGAIQVEKMLEAIEQEGYFSSWVIIEECTID